MTALGGAEGQLTGALGRLFAVAEAYPDLKANQNMLALQEELSATENKIAFARQAYNDAVMFYNTQRGAVSHRHDRRDVQLPGGASIRDRAARGAVGPQGLFLMGRGCVQ